MADVFISHSSKDRDVADQLCMCLEQRGITCWMAPRDIVPGVEWATAITTAISTSKIFLIIYSSNSANSNQVPKEINLASNKNLYIIPYKIDSTEFIDKFAYFLSNNHWIQADLSKKDLKIDELCITIDKVLNKNSSNATIINNAVINNPVVNTESIGVNQTTTSKVPNQKTPITKQTNSELPKTSMKFSKKLIIPIAVVLAVFIGVIVIVNITKKDTDDIAVNATVSNVTISSVDMSVTEEIIETNLEAQQEIVTTADIVETEETTSEIISHEVFVNGYAYVPTDFEPFEITQDKVILYKNELEKSFSMSGDEFKVGAVLNTRSNAVPTMQFNVKGMSTNLHFSVGHVDGSDKVDAKVYIALDGVDTQVLPVSYLELAQEYDIDITGVKLVNIYVKCDDYYGTLTGFADMYFYDNKKHSDNGVEQASMADGAAKVPSDFAPYETTKDKVTIYNNELEEVFYMSGDTYNSGIILNTRSNTEPSMLYNTKGMYTNMHFKVGHITDANYQDAKVYISLDGVDKHVFTASTFELAKEYDIDITDVKLVNIYVKCGDYYGTLTGFTDIYFYNKATYTPPTAPPVVLATKTAKIPSDLAPHEFSGDKKVNVYNNELEARFAMSGDEYNNGFVLNTRSNNQPSIQFNLRGMYKTLHFKAGHIDDSNKQNAKLYIVLDGVEKQVIEVKHNGLAQDYDIDVTGVKHLYFYVTCSDYYGTNTGLTNMSVS